MLAAEVVEAEIISISWKQILAATLAADISGRR
jgi:hypothetical protein